MQPPIIAFVPIREGSKGVPYKNTRCLGDKPLVCWILDTLLSSDSFDEIWVATDSKSAEIIINKRYASSVKVYHRTSESAEDESPVIQVVQEFLNSKPMFFDSILFLSQATVPFVSVPDIATAVEIIQSDLEHDSWLSCRRINKFSWSEKGIPLNYNPNNKPRRQEYNGLLLETGAFYASRCQSIRKTGLLLSGNIGVIESGIGTEIDIDTERDWQLAEIYLKYGLNT